jgi:glycosyltransferase involved in cell wall biosynthesis
MMYHEHDSPGPEDSEEGIGDRGKREDQTSIFQKIVMGARRELAKRTEICVLPNEERVEIFKKQTGTKRPVEYVWNVPRFEEVAAVKARPNVKEPLKLFYGGSLSSERLPNVLLDQILEMFPKISLHVVGYATYSHRALHQRLCELSKQNLIRYYGAMPRKEMWGIADVCEAAFCLMPLSSKDVNLRHMVGASNKPFDAMARGLAVVVSDMEEWKHIYIGIGDWPAQTYPCPSGTLAPQMKEYPLSRGDCEEGIEESPKFRIPESGKEYGIAINPESRKSIRAGLEWMLNNRGMLWEMGERGRQKIQNEWNYEKAFSPVLKKLEGWE